MPILPMNDQRLLAAGVRSLVDLGDGPDDRFFSVAQGSLRSLLGSPACSTSCRTPVHNHHCSCAYGVYLGSIEEVVYSVDAAGDAALESARSQHHAGFVGGSPLESGPVHEMCTSGADPAVSIHIFAYRSDHYADSIDRCFNATRPPRRPDDC